MRYISLWWGSEVTLEQILFSTLARTPITTVKSQALTEP